MTGSKRRYGKWSSKLTLTTQHLLLFYLQPERRNERSRRWKRLRIKRVSYIVRHKKSELLEDCRSLYLSWTWSTAHSPAPAGTAPPDKSHRSALSSTTPSELWRHRGRQGGNCYVRSTFGQWQRRRLPGSTCLEQEFSIVRIIGPDTFKYLYCP